MTVMRQQRLVGGDHILARRNRGLGCQTGGAFVATHHLDEHIDIIAFGQCHWVGFPCKTRQVGIAVLGPVTRGNGGDDHGAPGAGGNQIAVTLHDLDHANAHGAQTGNAKAQRGG